jgi:hypothetical protein
MAEITDNMRLYDTLGKPLQMIPWKQKDPNWYKRNINWFIGASSFNFANRGTSRRDLSVLYGVYNNKYPMKWFDHITNPLGSEKPRNYQAKIRPVTIIRTNIDLLLGEYPKRPFVYNVENLGESGYSEFMEQLNQAVQKNLTDHFINFTLQQMQAEGQQLTPQQLQKLKQDPPLPDKLKEEFTASYKDIRAIKGQKWLKRVIRERNVHRKLSKMFKDWLIAGEAYSYKTVRHGKEYYDRVSPMDIDYDRGADSDFVEDGNWVVARHLYSLPDIVDHFYDKLKEQEVKELETSNVFYSQDTFYKYLQGRTELEERSGIPCYHIQWIGYKREAKLSYLDTDTFQLVEEWVDENYVPDKLKGEKLTEWRWVNERYEGWRIGSLENDLFVDYGPSPLQRTENGMNTKPKLDYNGRKFSDTHAENISVLEIGLPFQLMFIIVNYILEKTIAKSKGKIVLMDKNIIPEGEEGENAEENFFYYAEALGFALVDRNQDGVDKTWNQYTVLDMSLFDQIKQLIELQESLKQQWDDVIGITRQRKGQTYASDGQGVNERSVFQSTVITDHIFAGFEEFQERELQGIMDLGKVVTAQGQNSITYDDMLGAEVLSILPEDFTNAELGVFVDSSAEHMRKLQRAMDLTQAMMQNEGKVSTILEVIDADNIAELKMKVKRIEAIEMALAQQNQEAEQEHEMGIEEMREKYLTLTKLLDRQNMNAEYDRKEILLEMELDHDTTIVEDAPEGQDSTAPEPPSIVDIQKLQNDRTKIALDTTNKAADRELKKADLQRKNTELALKVKELEHSIKMDKEELKLKGRKLTIDKMKARQKPKTTSKS